MLAKEGNSILFQMLNLFPSQTLAGPPVCITYYAWVKNPGTRMLVKNIVIVNEWGGYLRVWKIVVYIFGITMS